MRVYQTKCAQRGCECQVQAESPPENCPGCNNPLQEGGVIDVTSTNDPPAPPPAPEPAPAPAPEPAPAPAPTDGA